VYIVCVLLTQVKSGMSVFVFNL